MDSFGTDEIITRVVTSYSRMLLRIAMTRLRNPTDAEDAVQEVFLRLLTKRPEFRDAEHEKAWLIRATLQRADDLCRAAARRNLPLESADCRRRTGNARAPFCRADSAGKIQRCDSPLLL